MTPSTRAALINERDYQLETSARLFPQFVPSADTLAFLKVIERRLAELGMQIRNRQEMREQEWFSIDEVAALTGLSADHVRRHVTGGTLPVCNQGTFEKPYYRIRRSDIDAWMAQRMQQPGPAARKKKTTPGSYKSRHHGKDGG